MGVDVRDAIAHIAAQEVEDRRLSRPFGGQVPRLATADALRLGALYHVRLYRPTHAVGAVQHCMDGTLYVRHGDGSMSERLLCTSRVTLLREPPVCGCGQTYEWCERECSWPVGLEEVYWGTARQSEQKGQAGV